MGGGGGGGGGGIPDIECPEPLLCAPSRGLVNVVPSLVLAPGTHAWAALFFGRPSQSRLPAATGGAPARPPARPETQPPTQVMDCPLCHSEGKGQGAALTSQYKPVQVVLVSRETPRCSSRLSKRRQSLCGVLSSLRGYLPCCAILSFLGRRQLASLVQYIPYQQIDRHTKRLDSQRLYWKLVLIKNR